jgi:hypothetical protein
MGLAQRKVTLDFPAATYALVEDMADRYGTSASAIVRDAVSLLARLERDHRKGFTLFQRRSEDDKERELIILLFDRVPGPGWRPAPRSTPSRPPFSSPH